MPSHRTPPRDARRRRRSRPGARPDGPPAWTARLRGTALVLGGVALLAGAGGCGFVGVSQEVEQTETVDARVASDVKRALISVDGVDAAAVRVAVEENRVTLDGFVASEEEREAALAAARGALDGRELVDDLEVRR